MDLSITINENHPLFWDLFNSYTQYLGFRSPIKLKFHVGDIVELTENPENITYAKIKLIFKHKANNERNYAFFQFEKLQRTKLFDSVLECPYYVRKLRETFIFTINYVNHISQSRFMGDNQLRYKKTSIIIIAFVFTLFR
ncbi:5489_t:CDS:2 [Dentiscutata heterogama]|uniref:5489_t:CDS:1 n=1 Tax=Dentiscutata heterogama TaxID=1316150 RepID=A0ACA9KDM7_9GLOM|nr:5489_t:CDS:2 [Dentiscutata heterogama]